MALEATGEGKTVRRIIQQSVSNIHKHVQTDQNTNRAICYLQGGWNSWSLPPRRSYMHFNTFNCPPTITYACTSKIAVTCETIHNRGVSIPTINIYCTPFSFLLKYHKHNRLKCIVWQFHPISLCKTLAVYPGHGVSFCFVFRYCLLHLHFCRLPRDIFFASPDLYVTG